MTLDLRLYESEASPSYVQDSCTAAMEVRG